MLQKLTLIFILSSDRSGAILRLGALEKRDGSISVDLGSARKNRKTRKLKWQTVERLQCTNNNSVNHALLNAAGSFGTGRLAAVRLGHRITVRGRIDSFAGIESTKFARKRSARKIRSPCQNHATIHLNERINEKDRMT